MRIDNTRGNRGGRRENSVQDSHGLALGAQLSEFKLPRCKAGAVERKKEQVQKEQNQGDTEKPQGGLGWRRGEGKITGTRKFGKTFKPPGAPCGLYKAWIIFLSKGDFINLK